MYKKLEFITPDNDMIRATRDDDSLIILAPSGGDIWVMAIAGDLGEILPYVAPPPPPPPTQEQIDAELDAIADFVMETRGAVKALALAVFGEINILREQAGLPPRTVTQLRNSVRDNIE